MNDVIATSRPGSPTLLYDGECGVCTFLARLLARADLRHTVDILPFQDPRARELLRDWPQEEIVKAAHFVTVDGRVASGQEALHQAASSLPILGLPYQRLTDNSIGVRIEETLYSLGLGIRRRTACAVPSKSA